MLLRLLTGAALIHFGITGILEGTPPLTIALQVVGSAAGDILLLGLFTPLAGTLAAMAANGGSPSPGFPRIVPAIHGLPSPKRFWRQPGNDRARRLVH